MVEVADAGVISRQCAEWIKTRARNEALDCRVQAHAALCLLNPLWGAVVKRLAPTLPFSENGTEPAASVSRKLANSWVP